MRTRPAGTLARWALLTVTLAGLILGFALPAGASARGHRVPGSARTTPSLARVLQRSPLLDRVLGHGGRVTPAAVSNELSFNGSETVTSSTGVALNLNIAATEDLASGSTQRVSFDVDLSKQSGTDTDAHEWDFSLTRASVTFDSGTGVITLSSGKQINPFGKATLTFTPSFTGSEPCAVSGTTTFYQGDANGLFTFDTGSKKWGSVGSSSFTFEESSAEYDKACNQGKSPTSTPACTTSVSWEAAVSDTATNMTLLEGSSGDSGPNVGLVRAIALSAPSGAARLDVVIAPAPAPVLTVLSPGAKMTISTTPGDKVSTGSATATSSSSPTATTSTCLNSANKKKTETQDDWSAKVASDAGHTLVIKTAVGGNVKLKGSPGISGDIFQNSFA